jgi:phage gp29-like protein
MADKSLLEKITERLLYDFSGNYAANLSNWTAQNVYEIFEKMWILDDHIKGGLRIRKSKAFSFPWDVVPAEETPQAEEIALWVADALERLDIAETAGDLWTAVPMGFGVNEVVWGQRDDRLEIMVINGVHPKLITQNVNGPVIKTTGIEIETWKQPYKFLTMKYDPLFDAPDGLPVLAACYWPYTFKRLGLKFWATLLERFGVPSLAAMFDSSAPVAKTTPEVETIGEIATAITVEMSRLANGGAIAIPNIRDLKVLNPTGGGEDFEMFQTACNNAISVAILGNTMTMDSQSRGSQALGTVHQQITEDIGKGDSRFIARAINTLIRGMVDLNFGVDVPAPIFGWDTAGSASWDAVVQAIDRGVPVSRKKIYETLHGYEPADEEDTFVKAQDAAGTGGEVGMSARPFVRCSLPGRRRKESPRS